MTADYERRDRIDRLDAVAGDGTELVSVTVPPDATVQAVRSRVAAEHAEAANIKSDRTRNRVRRALDRLQRSLRQYESTPEHGLAAYAGVVDGDLVSAVFDDLPAPIPESTYHCDDHFDLTAVEAAVAPGDTTGLVVVERGGAAIGELAGDHVRPVRRLDSQVMGATRAGGQSAQRFARERERQKHEFFEAVADTANDAFLGPDSVSRLAVGGTLSTAKAFVNGGYLDHRLVDRLVGTFAVEYANARGLEQLVDAASRELLDAEARAARECLDDFFAGLRDDDAVTYGLEDVERAAEFGAVDSALVASNLPEEERAGVERAVDAQGGETYVVSTGTERGARFADAFGGVGALLRFPVN
ncbi:MAG: peptide chain release factor aRF-1 [Halobacterium sp.]